MNQTAERLAGYARFAQIILGIIGIFFILWIGQDIIIPVVFAALLSILLNPLVNYLCSKNINRIVSIVLALLVATIAFAALGYFIVTQIGQFSESFPKFEEKFMAMSEHLKHWVSSTFNVSPTKLNELITKSGKSMDSMAIIGQLLNTLKGFLVIFIMPVLMFIILYYKPLFLEFITHTFKKDEQDTVSEVLGQAKLLIQKYLVGLSFEAVIVAILNSAGLLIIGVPYAILLGVLSALLNVIPYIGILFASALSILVAVSTVSEAAALYTFLLFIVVQFVDNQYIVPKIVAGQVKINAFVSIVVILAGGALWGISGMFLAIPLTAILKVIFDHVSYLKPLGKVLGDTLPGATGPKERRTRKKS